MASDVLPDPDTPTTATVRHSGTSTSTSCRLLCRAPRTSMTAGRGSGTPGTEISSAAIPGTLGRRLVDAVGDPVQVPHASPESRTYLRDVPRLAPAQVSGPHRIMVIHVAAGAAETPRRFLRGSGTSGRAVARSDPVMPRSLPCRSGG